MFSSFMIVVLEAADQQKSTDIQLSAQVANCIQGSTRLYLLTDLSNEKVNHGYRNKKRGPADPAFVSFAFDGSFVENRLYRRRQRGMGVDIDERSRRPAAFERRGGSLRHR